MLHVFEYTLKIPLPLVMFHEPVDHAHHGEVKESGPVVIDLLHFLLAYIDNIRIDCEGRNRYCNTYFVSPLLKICRE
jgi:hypothetical protein